MNSAIDSRSILKITHRTFDELHLELGFGSFAEGLRYEFREAQQTIGVLGILGFLGLLGAQIAPILRDAFAENPVEGWILLGFASFSLLAVAIGCIVGYTYAQSWMFERSTDTLLWTQKFLLGSRTKRYRLERFFDVAVLNPSLQKFPGQCQLALVRQGWHLFPSGKYLHLIKIGSRDTPHLQARIAHYQHLSQEIATFMSWPAD
ncbi:MAG: hypothetical protein F6J87_04500 [Spirulina sp. SIO3F2]|nr:hypothetical protein [Spirulina sp. SIO3F2]